MFTSPFRELGDNSVVSWRPGRAGFTLLEILVAVAILGIIMTTVYGVLSRTLYSKGYAEDRADMYAAGREAVLKIASDLEAALPPTPRGEIAFRTLTQSDQPPRDAVQFSINTHSGLGAAVPQSGRATITYSLAPLSDANQFFIVRRDEVPIVAEETGPDDGTDDLQAEEVPTPHPKISFLNDDMDCTDQRFCVVGLRFQYLDGESGQWVADWDSTTEDHFDKLPVAVQITLYMSDNNGTIHDFGTIADLIMAPSTLPTPTPGRNLVR